MANKLWKRLLRSLVADPGRFAGATAVRDPLGLLAMEREQLTAKRDSVPPDAGTGTRAPARVSTGATNRPPAGPWKPAATERQETLPQEAPPQETRQQGKR